MAIELTASGLKRLTKLADGGEASIYEFGVGEVIKIFHPTTRVQDKMAKVQALLASGLRGPQLVLPTDTVEIGGKFAGYAMPKINGASPLHDFTKARFVKAEQLTNLDALKIVASIGTTIGDIHRRRIVIGDVSDNNFMASIRSPNAVYFIDLDSWGLNGLRPDAFTETFVPPESYGKSGMTLDANTDCFGYAILAFLVLTRLHPFNGTYVKDDKMSVTGRIKNGLSVLGDARSDIVINKAIPSWSWMSPDLLENFLMIFEKGSRENIVPLIEDQVKHSKKCPIHGVYYYDRFADCPLCSGRAKVIVAQIPTVAVATGTGPRLVVVFEGKDVRLMLGLDSYIAMDGDVVHRPSGRRVRFLQGKTHFAANGKFTLGVSSRSIRIENADGKELANIPRAHNSSYAVQGANLLYVDQNEVVRQLTMTPVGLSDGEIQQSHNPLLAMNARGEAFILARYVDRLLATYGGRDVEIGYAGKITEWTIKFDEKTETWIFVFELANGKHRTIIFGKKGIEYDSDVVHYDATPLSNLCYCAGVVYDPGNGEIIGTNLLKNTAKKFACSAVDAGAALNFREGGFDIVADDKLYRFG